MPKRYRKLRGDTAYYPFAARTGLRARQRRHVRVLRGAGLAALALAAVLLVRQTVFRGGQPDAPAAVPTAPAVTALPAPTHVTVQPLAATRDALADTQRADASAHTTPETAAVPAAAAGEIRRLTVDAADNGDGVGILLDLVAHGSQLGGLNALDRDGNEGNAAEVDRAAHYIAGLEL